MIATGLVEGAFAYPENGVAISGFCLSFTRICKACRVVPIGGAVQVGQILKVC